VVEVVNPKTRVLWLTNSEVKEYPKIYAGIPKERKYKYKEDPHAYTISVLILSMLEIFVFFVE
jgi:hypothetical protein